MPFQLVFSRLAAFFEGKLFNMLALAIFEMGSVICALASNSPVFILGRAISGLGAAGIVAGMFVVINTIPMRERPRLLAIFFALQSIAFTAGPTLSGVLTDSYLTVRNTIQEVNGSKPKQIAVTDKLVVLFPLFSGGLRFGFSFVSFPLS